ncbi:MAG TPA: hypothetical protein VEK85_17210 [Gemmatimonadales bacterium]|nr:hypothetical protein [Gemmatimonadales bacterium]
MPRRRRKVVKPVARRVLIYAGGRCVKTVRHTLTIAQAVRELGGDPVGREGALMTGGPIVLRRSLCKGVRVELAYQCDVKPGPLLSTSRASDLTPLGDAVAVVRAHLAG